MPSSKQKIVSPIVLKIVKKEQDKKIQKKPYYFILTESDILRKYNRFNIIDASIAMLENR